MNITYEILAANLANEWPIQLWCEKEHLALSPPLFYRATRMKESNQLYIVTDDLPAEDAEGVFIFCKPVDLQHVNYSRIVFYEPVREMDVLNAIQELFQRCSKWEQALESAVVNRVSLQGLLDIGTAFLKCQLSVTDENLQLLAVSSYDETVLDFQFESLPPFGFMEVMERANVQLEGDFYVLHLSKLPYSKIDYDIYSIQIKDGDTVFGSFSMHSTKRELKMHDFQLFKVMYAYVRKHLFNPILNEEYVFARLTERLISGEDVQLGELTKLKTQAAGVLECVVMDVPKKMLMQYGGFIKLRIQSVFSQSILLMTEQQIVCVTYGDKPTWHEAASQKLLMDSIGTEHITVGISKPFQKWEHLSMHFEQANAALQYTTVNEPLQLFSSIWSAVIFEQVLQKWPVESVYRSSFQRLLAYNAQAAVDYVESLQIWLEEGLNDSRTAARLFISRNSFLSRRERMEIILSDNLSDPEVRFQLYMNVRLYQHQLKCRNN